MSQSFTLKYSRSVGDSHNTHDLSTYNYLWRLLVYYTYEPIWRKRSVLVLLKQIQTGVPLDWGLAEATKLGSNASAQFPGPWNSKEYTSWTATRA